MKRIDQQLFDIHLLEQPQIYRVAKQTCFREKFNMSDTQQRFSNKDVKCFVSGGNDFGGYLFLSTAILFREHQLADVSVPIFAIYTFADYVSIGYYC